MKSLKIVILISCMLSMIGCTLKRVPPGTVGVKVYMNGQKRGVQSEELPVGRYWIKSWNEEVYLYPTFTQNYVWTSDRQEGSPNNESFNFQDIQGLELNADIGISYSLDQTKINNIFQKYRKGIDEITDVFLRNMVRDALVSRSSKLNIEYIYGEGRAGLIDSITTDVRIQCKDIGINIEKIYWIGRIKLPATVKNAIDDKIKSTQIAIKVENELRETEAAAKKAIAEAEGKAKSKILIAEAEARSNSIISKSLTKELVNYETVKRWDGKLPQVSGSNTPFVSLGK